MELLNGVVLKSSSSSSICCKTQIIKPLKSSCLLKSQVCFRKGNRIPGFRGIKIKAGFEDKGHVEYYDSGVSVSPVCLEKKGMKGWNGIPMKKRMKLLKGLVKDLSTFSDLGFGLDFDDDKSKNISQAAETLLAQLKLLKAEEEKMKKCKPQDCESSSSSSESSDSECDEVIDMKSMKNKAVVRPVDSKLSGLLNEESPSTTIGMLPEQSLSGKLSENSEQKSCINMILDLTLNQNAVEALQSNSLGLNQSNVGSIEKTIEVCMGGKCKKSGSPALMQEFQRVMGSEGGVVGCKCMGKCKSAPNVRVLHGSNVDDNALRTSNSLCMGVGLEDVELIVANYCEGESKDQLRVAAVPIV